MSVAASEDIKEMERLVQKSLFAILLVLETEFVRIIVEFPNVCVKMDLPVKTTVQTLMSVQMKKKMTAMLTPFVQTPKDLTSVAVGEDMKEMANIV